VAKQQLGQPVLGTHQVPAAVLTSTDQFACSFLVERGGRRQLLHIKTTAPWANPVVTGRARLTALATP
jgi:hypothetical protein